MRKAAFLLLLALLACTAASGQKAGNLSGKVVDVANGDTITIVDKRKTLHIVRLAGIDAPEQGQEFSAQARKYLSDLIFGKDVRIEGKSYDQFGRLRGKVLLNGRDMNLEQVIAGLAWHHNEIAWDQNERDRQVYESAELIARRSKYNIWSAAKPTPPWEFSNKPVAVEAKEDVPQVKPFATQPGAASTDPVQPLDIRTLSLPSGKIIGNKNSRIYHWPGCPGYTKIAEQNRVPFNSTAEAEAAGYRAAKNCKQ